jgi:hypothetical protein
LLSAGRNRPDQQEQEGGRARQLLHELLELSACAGGTRCEVQVFGGTSSGDRLPLVVVTELQDNPGLPVSAVFPVIADEVRARNWLPPAPEPLWVEVWWGRALAGVLDGAAAGAPRRTTCMTVDLSTTPALRAPIRRTTLARRYGIHLPAAHLLPELGPADGPA